ncbi:GAF domain-containing protein [Flavobacterium sp.]|uniref:GAF domain-containing protein n=1 Tax=Flavobacterium sp. TaxID=239 RepID=UPI0026199E26|nr:GAF domain-containing protein [Flavobacterium sp.]
MVQNYKYISPFKVLIAFQKIIEGLEQIAVTDVSYRANYAKALLTQIEDKPEFRVGIDELDFVEKNQELIQYLLADLFPTALTNNEIKAATIPFYDFTFNYSQRFKKILNDVEASFDLSIRNMDEHQFFIMNCTLILNFYFHQNIDFGKPIFYDIPDKNGILKHYRILYNVDFLEIFPTDNAKFLNQTEIDELVDNYDNLDLWKKAFPEHSWILKGFAIVSLVDVTVESAVSNLKSNLLKSDTEKAELGESFESIFRSVFKIPDLRIGFTFYDEEEDLFLKPPFNDEKLHSYILLDEQEADCKNALCGCSYEHLIEDKKPFVIPNVAEYATEQDNINFATHLINQGVQSFLLAPVIKDKKLLGLLELASATGRALNSVNANKLELILPYLSDTIEKNNSDMMNQLEVKVVGFFDSL